MKRQKDLFIKTVKTFFFIFTKVEMLHERERDRGVRLWLKSRLDTYIQSLTSSLISREVWYRASNPTRGLPNPANCQPDMNCLLIRLLSSLGSKTSVFFNFSGHQNNLPSGAIHVAFSQSFIYLKTQLHILFPKHTLTGSQRSIYNTNTLNNQIYSASSKKICQKSISVSSTWNPFTECKRIIYV